MILKYLGATLLIGGIYGIGSNIYKGINELKEVVKSDYEKCMNQGDNYIFNEHTQECKYENPCVSYTIKN